MDEFSRMCTFALVCVPARLFLAYLAAKGLSTPSGVCAVVTIALVLSLGFVRQYFAHSKHTGYFGGPAWWQPLRLLHAGMYILFAALALNKSTRPHAHWVLVADVLFGVGGALVLRVKS